MEALTIHPNILKLSDRNGFTHDDCAVFTYSNHREAPTFAGIYFVVADETVLYIGESGNIKRRMASHDRRDAFLTFGASVRCIKLDLDADDRKALEAVFIKIWSPPLNGAPSYVDSVSMALQIKAVKQAQAVFLEKMPRFDAPTENSRDRIAAPSLIQAFLSSLLRYLFDEERKLSPLVATYRDWGQQDWETFWACCIELIMGAIIFRNIKTPQELRQFLTESDLVVWSHGNDGEQFLRTSCLGRGDQRFSFAHGTFSHSLGKTL